MNREEQIRQIQALLNVTREYAEKMVDEAPANQISATSNDVAPDKILTELPKELEAYLYPHQKEAIQFLYETIIRPPDGFRNHNEGHGALIAHCMGLGKTTTIAGFLYGILKNEVINTKISRILIISPVNVISNWMTTLQKPEFNDFFKNIVSEIDAPLLKKPDPNSARRLKVEEWFENRHGKKIMIIGYNMFDLLANDPYNVATKSMLKEYLQNPGPDLVICDEGHLLKNNERTNFLSKNSIKTKRRIILTGTPIQNDLMELYNVMQFVNLSVFPYKIDYEERYVEVIEKAKVKNATEEEKALSEEREIELYDKLQNTMHRLDGCVLTKLLGGITKKETTITMIETDEQRFAIDSLAEQYQNAKKGDKNFLQYFHSLINLTSHPIINDANRTKRKIKDMNDDDKDPNRSNKMRILFKIIEACENNNEKLVIFAEKILTLDYIQDFVNKRWGWHINIDFFRVDGAINSTEREKFFGKFNDVNDHDSKMFLLSTKAASVGVDLIGANRMVLFDHGFNPVHNIQAVYRIYRIGQIRNVYIYRLETKNSDDCLLRRQITKESLSHRTIDNRSISAQFSEDQLKIVRGYEPVTPITHDRLNQLDDPFLKAIINDIPGAVADFNDHEEHFIGIDLEEEQNKEEVDSD